MKYDDKGNIIETIILQDKFSNQYEFDEVGNWIRKMHFKNGVPTIIIIRTISYY